MEIAHYRGGQAKRAKPCGSAEGHAGDEPQVAKEEWIWHVTASKADRTTRAHGLRSRYSNARNDSVQV